MYYVTMRRTKNNFHRRYSSITFVKLLNNARILSNCRNMQYINGHKKYPVSSQYQSYLLVLWKNIINVHILYILNNTNFLRTAKTYIAVFYIATLRILFRIPFSEFVARSQPTTTTSSSVVVTSGSRREG